MKRGILLRGRAGLPFYCLERLETRTLLAATLVSDIYPGTTGSDPTGLVAANGTLFFAATDAANGTELWSTDGTAGGTRLVTDINPGSAGSAPSSLTSAGGALYFAADDGSNGRAVWKSDGTEAGTVLVTDLGSFEPRRFFASGTKVFFTTGTPGFAGDVNLYVTDGTAVGTKSVKIGGGDVRGITASANALYFDVDGGQFGPGSGHHLMRTDGTTTTTIVDIDSGYSIPSIDVNGTLFFVANQVDLWKTDGTPAGTLLVKSDISPSILTNINGTLFFRGTTPADGGELWKSDGTPGGTVLVTNIAPGGGSSDPVNLANISGTLYFSANQGGLWKSDGTAAGTILVNQVATSSLNAPASITDVNGTPFFTVGYNRDTLWTSDGTSVRTVDVSGGATSFSSLTNFAGAVFVSASTAGAGRELWTVAAPPAPVATLTSTGTLMINGTTGSGKAGRDRIIITRDSKGRIVVTSEIGVTAGVQTFAKGSVKRVLGTLNGGNDYLEIRPGVMGVSISGGSGYDTLIGGDGADDFLGAAQNDLIFGGVGNDILRGGGGKDTLSGEAGADVLVGGAGNDSLIDRAGFAWGAGRGAGDVAVDVISGGKDIDTAIIDDDEDDISGVEIFA